MTEQEIVNYLKENKNKGIAYMFLPEDVRDWIGENLNDPKLIYLSPSGTWRFYFETDFDDYDNVVFALHEHYQVKKESKGEWVEFVINDDGIFTEEFGTGEEAFTEDFRWWNWQEFLDQASNNDMGFTTFGGWQYAESNSDFWYTQPMTIRNDDGALIAGYKDDDKPAIPVKIRFWRESK